MDFNWNVKIVAHSCTVKYIAYRDIVSEDSSLLFVSIHVKGDDKLFVRAVQIKTHQPFHWVSWN